MKRIIAVLVTISIIISLLTVSNAKASVIDAIVPIQTIGIPQDDFIGSATLAEVNFFENDFDTRFLFPMQGMSVTDDGLIAVIDNAYGRIHVLTPLLQEKFSFGSLKEFTYPTDIAYANNCFYIVDPFRRELRLYNKDGIFLKSIKNAQFSSPIGIAVTSSNIFVSDYFSNSILKLDMSGKIISSTNVQTPLGLTLDKVGNICAVSGKDRKIYVFDSSFKLLNAFGDDVLLFPSDLAVDSKGYIYVVDRGLDSGGTNRPKVVVFDNNYKLVNTFGSFSSSLTSIPDGAFLTPSGIVVSSTNSVYVFDSGYFFYLQSNSDAPFGYPLVTRLSVFNTSGYFINKKDFVRDSSKGILLNPVAASLDENGYTWVLNKGNLDQSEIVRFSPDGSLSLRITKIGSQMLPSLTSIYADKRGNLIVIGNNQIILYSTSGSFKQNVINANFGLLKRIIFSNGYYWVTSQDKNLVFKLDTNFKVVGSFGVCNSPSGIAFNSKGYAFITSLEDNKVHVYDANFKEISSFGGPGKSSFKLYIPEDVGIDKEGNVYVTNTENGRISVFTNSFAPLFETDSNYLGLTSIEIVDSHIITCDAFHNVVWIFEVKKQYPDYSFALGVSPEVAVISPKDFVNIYFTVSNTGLKADSYSYTVSLTNTNSFKFSLVDSNSNFSLAPNSSKRIRVFIESKETAIEGDSTQIIIKVNSTNEKISISSNATVKIATNLKPSIFIDDVSSKLGENVSVPVYIKNAQGIRGVSFDLNFDKNKVVFNGFNLSERLTNSVLLTNANAFGISVLIEFPKDSFLYNSTLIGYLSFKSLEIGSTVLQILNPKYATVTDEIQEFDLIYPGGITITPSLSVNIPDNFTTPNQTIIISGKTTPDCEVFLNGISISVASDGSFSYKLTLSSYTQTLIITSKAKTGEETTLVRIVKFTGKLKITLVLQINNPIMYVNGIPEEIDPGRGTSPIIISGWNRTVVPIRAIVEKIGGSVLWDATNKRVLISVNNKEIDLQIGNNVAKVDGKEIQIDPFNPLVKPLIINDRTMVPLRFVAEQIGCTVTWDEKEKKITIEYIMP
ncbi:stalk domain-containing protein [Caldisericum exile]|uniref:Copper amine oxidase-like N-terminal domain-containing protein n=1 Tax=Caldisericum exile (strain DSM 21853 / NBRC 104410 / AZM16c01) TaxID=511051 RepID=A0A7U6JF12_CALEA|nr:stalk domain-containing protein [Caldisericum exile]BAL81003.1 hypothetical protein CSE_08770 [Caldisericum exile AZM16c01]